MRQLSSKQYMELCGLSPNTLKARERLHEVALAHGIGRRLAGGVYMPQDCIAHELVNGLMPTFPRKHAASIVRAFPDVWLAGVGRAEIDPEPIWFSVTHDPATGRYRAGVVCMADKKPIKFSEHPEFEVPERIVFINLTTIMARVRAKAAAAGLDFSEPFFPPPGDLEAAKIIEAAKKQRVDALRAYEHWHATQKPTAGEHVS